MVTWFINDSIFSFDINTNYSLDNPGINKVMLLVEDSNRCIDSITKNIITYYDFMLYIPTSFSPNNDGINDSFAPKGLRMDKYLAYEFEIFNRWGDKVFKTNDVNAKWNGDGVQDGIYNWVVNLVDELGKLRVESGEVTLFR
jgi:gliding motility-associated-like protein